MENFILVVHVLIAIAMTGFILLQQGKGAEMGASFGAGSSQTVFGSAGSAGFLTKATAVLALIFFATSITLAIFAKKKVEQVTMPFIPAAAVVEKAPAAPANADVPSAAASQPVAPAAAVTAVPAPVAPAVAPPPAVVPAAAAPKLAPVVKKAVVPVPVTPAPAAAAPVVEQAPSAPAAETPAEPAVGTSNP
jgi:preprotein translocase subunit SecG